MLSLPAWLAGGGRLEVSSMQIIPRFNPYYMSDDMVLKLNTGRDRELDFVLKTIEANTRGDQSPQHVLIHGPRGSGKSFFLRLVQIGLRERENTAFCLFSEEQSNLFQPADLLIAIRNYMAGIEQTRAIAVWQSGGREEWDREARKLEELAANNPGTHIVIGLENFDLLLGSGGAFENREDQFLLRQFLTEKKWLTMIATTLYPDLDTHYEKALFHSFAKYELRPWEENDHQQYLARRMQLESKKPESMTQAQIKALTRFTGGSPRITVIMVDVLSYNQLESATATLETTIDMLTPFYQDLLNRIPTKSKLLFDALIRGGEPCSQSEIAARVGATQNMISRSFNWLVTHQYLAVDTPKGERQKFYSVRDRLFAHYYWMRHIQDKSITSLLPVMSEFLTTFFSTKELREHADLFLEHGQPDKCKELLQITLRQSGVDTRELSWRNDIKALCQALDLTESEVVPTPVTFEDAWTRLQQMKDMLNAATQYPKIDKKAFSRLLFGSPYLSFAARLEIARKLLNRGFSEEECSELYAMFSRHNAEFLDLYGRAGALLMEGLRTGELIVECLDHAYLDRLKQRDRVLHAACVLCLKDLWSFSSSCPIGAEASAARTTNERPRLEATEVQDAFQFLNTDEYMGVGPERRAFYLEKLASIFEDSAIYQEAIEIRQLALELRVQAGDIPRQAGNLNRISQDLYELGLYEEAINGCQKALEMYIEEGNSSQQADTLLGIAVNLWKLGRYEEAVSTYHKALEWSQQGDVLLQAKILESIALSLWKLGRYEESISECRKALMLRTEGDDISQASILLLLGNNLFILGRHKESVNAHQESLKICVQSGDIPRQAQNHECIGANLFKMGRYEESINAHRKGLELRAQEIDIPKQLRILLQLAGNYYMLGKSDEAGNIVDQYLGRLSEGEATDAEAKLAAFLANVVADCEKRNELAQAFSVGAKILGHLAGNKDRASVRCAQGFFLGLWFRKPNLALLEDLLNEVLQEENDELAVRLLPIRGAIDYIKSGRQKNFLIKMQPEERKAVESLLAGLDPDYIEAAYRNHKAHNKPSQN